MDGAQRPWNELLSRIWASLKNGQKQPQVLRLRLAQKTSQTSLRMKVYLFSGL